MTDEDEEWRYPVYTTQAAYKALNETLRNEVYRLRRLKRPSKAQRKQLALLEEALRAVEFSYGDSLPSKSL